MAKIGRQSGEHSMPQARLPFSVVVAMSLGCGSAAAQSAYGGVDGSSVERAVVINAGSEMGGTGAEYEWIRSNYQGWRVKRQALIGGSGGRRYDRLTIVSPSGQERHIYFDITNYFGKL